MSQPETLKTQIETGETGYAIPSNVLQAIQTVHAQGKKVVVMTCGIAGSGKSTLARNLERGYGFVRLSIDAHILSHHGTYNVDYPPEKLDELQDEAETVVKQRLETLLQPVDDLSRDEDGDRGIDESGNGCRDVILDLSLYSKSDRDLYRGMVNEIGGESWGAVLVVFEVTGSDEEKEDVLWRRIEGRERELRERSEREDREMGSAREGMPVSRELLGVFLKGFEWPVGEGEVRVHVE
ncbi:hypothetical protein VTL71DRAFT_13299 [Oculimacula yallundae]|uniref:P-loop containing nucleoside triphosphate hydrolase protein n=1 Tax=Oculimacula yallundae TaxID=86028 RepID=A0ABR4CK41_9HELO